ncbi:probable WRKY transcription factor 14 [Sesamum indicum]|uniref:Probable WRKY transcription factor 14 n=1 Tax=Sesamum indicum TaxID=4182 RepID=A0A6I9UPZ5_SESIN|nr:probable WRKY transcription factor 14 [Sesamum indicum]
MCSQFLKRMENYQGDLTDIIRASGGGSSIAGGNTAAEPAAAPHSWQFPTSNPVNYSTDPPEDFGDPFTHLRDPLLHDIDTPVSGFFHNSNIIKPSFEETGNTAGGFAKGSINLAHRIPDDEMERPASNIFSRMLQIAPTTKLPVSPCDSPAVVAAASPRGLEGPPVLVPNSTHTLISPNSSSGCLVESPGLQISSPRNTGIKRRKSQAKKVVCIPAPAPANSRPSGEVVPSDLWAWRKYGQKPIKGSPYPRGYYRCSSSKGCSARKQVERSRTDPNMLVITYTSEHNHPWPTQRNALAGSTRAQPSKSSTAAKSSPNSQAQKSTNPKEEMKEFSTEKTAAPSSSSLSAAVKEEMHQDLDHNQVEMDDPEFDEGFPNSYKPTLPDSNHSEDSFFADLEEIEADSLDILFTQGFSGDDGRDDDKALDPFSFYDWATGNNTSTSTSTGGGGGGATTSYGEAKRGE